MLQPIKPSHKSATCELNTIGSNFNQLVRKVNATSQTAEMKGLLLLFESQKKAILSKIDEVKEQLQKLAERWLQ
jgi:hypothetical protein